MVFSDNAGHEHEVYIHGITQRMPAFPGFVLQDAPVSNLAKCEGALRQRINNLISSYVIENQWQHLPLLKLLYY